MKPNITNHRQGRLFEARLSEQLNPFHPLFILTDLIDWETLEKDLERYFTEEGSPGKPIRLVTGIFMLQHMSGVSDEQAVKAWVENPYWQFFCGYDFLQWEFPIHPSSLSRWRARLGESGMKKILEATIRSAVDGEIISRAEMSSVIVDTTVMPKNITHPTDTRLYYKCIQSLVCFAKRFRLELRQTYKFVSKKALRLNSQYLRARRPRQAKREQRRLRVYLGRVLREVERYVEKDKELALVAKDLLQIIRKIFEQKRDSKEKIYSLHEPHVECIAKGKAHKKYEFGCKSSLVITSKKGLVLSSEALHGNPFDGHTLRNALLDAESNSGVFISRALADKGYRGHKITDKEIFLPATRKLSRHFKKVLNRRQAIEPVIGHMKSDGKLGKCFLKGKLGDDLNAILCGVGYNMRLVLRSLVPKLS